MKLFAENRFESLLSVKLILQEPREKGGCQICIKRKGVVGEWAQDA